MAAPMVHVENDNSSDSEAISDQISDSIDPAMDDSRESNDDEENDDTTKVKKSGLGNVMTKILHKKVDTKCAVLSKGLTDRQINRKRKQKDEDDDTEVTKTKGTKVEDSSEDSDNSDSSDSDNETSSSNIDPLRVKPNPLKKDFEKNLQKIATKGVVHLFNAVQKQQKTLEEKLNEAGSSEVKKGKALKNVTKGGFMDMLKPTDKPSKSNDMVKDTEPSWKILRDDFMMGAKLKDWDKDSDNENGGDSDGS